MEQRIKEAFKRVTILIEQVEDVNARALILEQLQDEILLIVENEKLNNKGPEIPNVF